MRYSAKSMIAVISLAILMSACPGHYNPRMHVHETPAKPIHVKQKYYH